MYFSKVWLLSCPLLFALCPGDDFFVQYAPNDPKRLYIRERTQAIFQEVVAFLIAVLILAWAIRRHR
jgi:hypothetical protein